MKNQNQNRKPLTPLITKHEVKQNTPEWLKLREQYRCASETATLVKSGFMNNNIPIQDLVKSAAYNESVQKIIVKLKGKVTGTYTDTVFRPTTIPAMLHGSRCENSAADIIIKKHTPNDLRILSAESEVITYNQYLASIDVAILTTNEDLPKVYIEIKCPYNIQTSQYWKDSYDQLNTSIQSQMQHQMLVTGVNSMVYFAFHFDKDTEHYQKLIEDPTYLLPQATDCKHFVVKRDQKFIDSICSMWDRLYHYCVTSEVESLSLASPIFAMEYKLFECNNEIARQKLIEQDLREQILAHIDPNEREFLGTRFRIQKQTITRNKIIPEKVQELLSAEDYAQCIKTEKKESYCFYKLEKTSKKTTVSDNII